MHIRLAWTGCSLKARELLCSQPLEVNRVIVSFGFRGQVQSDIHKQELSSLLTTFVFTIWPAIKLNFFFWSQ